MRISFLSSFFITTWGAVISLRLRYSTLNIKDYKPKGHFRIAVYLVGDCAAARSRSGARKGCSASETLVVLWGAGAWGCYVGMGVWERGVETVPSRESVSMDSESQIVTLSDIVSRSVRLGVPSKNFRGLEGGLAQRPILGTYAICIWGDRRCYFQH